MVPHSELGDHDCCGFVMPWKGEYVCNECAARIDENAFLVALAETPETRERCPHCGFVNVLQWFDKVLVFTCGRCGKAVQLEQ